MKYVITRNTYSVIDDELAVEKTYMTRDEFDSERSPLFTENYTLAGIFSRDRAFEIILELSSDKNQSDVADEVLPMYEMTMFGVEVADMSEALRAKCAEFLGYDLDASVESLVKALDERINESLANSPEVKFSDFVDDMAGPQDDQGMSVPRPIRRKVDQKNKRR